MLNNVIRNCCEMSEVQAGGVFRKQNPENKDPEK